MHRFVRTVATILQASRKQFSSVSIDNNVISTIIEVGKINGSITVYRDNLAPIDFVIICSKDDTISNTGSILDSGKCVRIIDIRNLLENVFRELVSEILIK